MYSNMSVAEVYGREADRLRSMAEAVTYQHVRDGFLHIAHLYDLMAQRAERMTDYQFARPLGPRSGGPVPPHG